MEALQGDLRHFFTVMFRHRMGRIQQGHGMLQAVLPEVMVSPERRGRLYRQFVLRIATLLEQYVQARAEMRHIRPVDAPLTARAVQGMVVGLLILCIRGGEPLRAGWGDVPDVLTTLIFDGLSPRADEEGG